VIDRFWRHRYAGFYTYSCKHARKERVSQAVICLKIAGFYTKTQEILLFFTGMLVSYVVKVKMKGGK